MKNLNIFLMFSLFSIVQIYGQEQLLWSGLTGGGIYISDMDGSNLESLVDFPDRGLSLTVDEVNNYVYWTNDGNIYRTSYDGESIDTLIVSEGIVWGLAVDIAGAKLFWGNASEDKIFMSNTDGSEIEVLMDQVALNPFSFDFFAPENKLYFGTQGGLIVSISLSTLTIETLIYIDYLPTEIEIDPIGEKIYWVNQNIFEEVSEIQRASLDGSDIETLVSGLGNPYGLALSQLEQRVYWSDWDQDYWDISSANFDGSDVVNVYDNSDLKPYSLSIITNFTTATQTVEKSKVPQVFPNPTAGQLTIDAAIPYDQVTVYNQNGAIMGDVTIQEDRLDLSSLAAGVYIIQFATASESISSQKIIKL